MNKSAFILILILICVGIASRFLFISDGQPIFPNLTAIGAVALFGANYLKGIYRWIIPISALWVSDLVLNNVVYGVYFDSFQWYGSPWVYAGFLAAVLIGILLMKKPSWMKLLMAAVTSGVVFYLITNFAVWISPTSPYSKDFGGLLSCYGMALPFFRNTLIGNVLYSAILFGAYEWITSASSLMQGDRKLSLV